MRKQNMMITKEQQIQAQTRKLFLLFNHNLTQIQDADARASLGVCLIVEPPAEIQAIWSGVPPEAAALSDWLAPIFAWLAQAASPGDFVLIQGEFGATWLAVHKAFDLGLVPVYSTTGREAVEEHQPDGSVHIRHIFSHVRYRRYEPPVRCSSRYPRTRHAPQPHNFS